MEFWTALVSEYCTLRQFAGVRYTVVLGDANLHLPELVHHHIACKCAHCRPSKVDATVAHLLKFARLYCINQPDTATHVSGTIIDLFFTDCPAACAASSVSPPGVIAMSDHGLVAASVAGTLRVNCSVGFGRVWWASYGDWDHVLSKLDYAFHGLADIINGLAAHPSLVNAANQGREVTSQSRHRRGHVGAGCVVCTCWPLGESRLGRSRKACYGWRQHISSIVESYG